MGKYTLYTFLSGLAIILLFNFFISEPHFDSKLQQINHLKESGRYAEAEKLYLLLIQKDSLNENLHYGYIQNHYRMSGEEDKLTPETFYAGYCHSPDTRISDLGFYGLGLCAFYQNNTEKALNHFAKVQNRNLKYLNNSMGRCLMYSGRERESEKYFLKEITLKGDSAAAYNNLAELFKQTGEKGKLRSLLQNKETEKYIDENFRREFYFLEANLTGYFGAITDNSLHTTNRYGFIAALFILIVWIVYLRKLDLYEKEKWSVVILIVFLGILFAQVTFLLHDFNVLILGNNLTGEFWNDFFYSVFGIGAIEELVKIIPLFLLLAFTKEINEPIDYIKYASLSAAGFAFSENLLYFEENALSIIPGRALLCVTGHMFYSSIIAYGIMLSAYKAHRFPLLTLIISFLLASVFHGFYDFWLINESVSAFSKVSFIFFFFSTLGWIMLVNNCLSNSPFYDREKIIDASRLRDYLFAGLIAIFILQFILISIRQSPSAGNMVLLKETTFGLIVLPLVVKIMSNLNILNNYWYHNIALSRNILFENLLGKKLRFISRGNEKTPLITSPIEGTVQERKLISNNPNWFLVELNESFVYKDTAIKHIYISPKDLSPRLSLPKSFKAYCMILTIEAPTYYDKLEINHFRSKSIIHISLIQQNL